MGRTYIKYLKAGRHPYGVVVLDEKGRFGWSLVNPKDHFSYVMGKKIAFGRAACTKHGAPMPLHIYFEKEAALEWLRKGVGDGLEALPW